MKEGANLASVTNTHEEAALKSLIGAAGEPRYWFGIHDNTKEGRFDWRDKSPVEYTNWLPGQPDNYKETEDCGEIRVDTMGWNDLPCGVALPAVCSARPDEDGVREDIVRQTIEGSKYFVLQDKRRDWQESKEACAAEGGKLAQILCDEDQVEAAMVVEADGYPRYWLGINEIDEEGVFRNLDGEVNHYSNWHKNRPNNWIGFEEDCVGMVRDYDFHWDDIRCWVKRWALCQVGESSGKKYSPNTPF